MEMDYEEATVNLPSHETERKYVGAGAKPVAAVEVDDFCWRLEFETEVNFLQSV